MIIRTRALGAVSAVALACALTSAAQAQSTSVTTDQQPSTKESTIETIVVTGERTTQNVMKVPASISVLSAQQLEDKNVVQISDLQYATPSLSITDAALSQNVNIRGIGLSSGNPNVVPGVPVYLELFAATAYWHDQQLL